jgi:hypothetical protein
MCFSNKSMRIKIMRPKHEVLSNLPMVVSEMVPVERERQAVPVDTYGGRVHVEWDQPVAVTEKEMGQLPFFIAFL